MSHERYANVAFHNAVIAGRYNINLIKRTAAAKPVGVAEYLCGAEHIEHSDGRYRDDGDPTHPGSNGASLPFCSSLCGLVPYCQDG
jgi:hypothetical protein